MRLIDADRLKRQITGMTNSRYPVNKADAWRELIDAQPTVYDDVQKTLDIKIRIFRGLRDCNDYFAGLMQGYEEAIELIKGGGTDAD